MEIKGLKRVQEFKNEFGLIDRWTYRGNTLIKAEYSYPKLIKTKKEMSEKTKLFEQINTNFQSFVENHNGTTKKSQANARKYLGEVKKLVTAYRKASVDEGK